MYHTIMHILSMCMHCGDGIALVLQREGMIAIAISHGLCRIVCPCIALFTTAGRTTRPRHSGAFGALHMHALGMHALGMHALDMHA